MKKTILAFFIVISLISCKNKATNDKAVETGIRQKNNAIDTVKNAENRILGIEAQTLTIDTFSVFLPEIDGCACYSSNNSNELKANKYIYAQEYGENAFVSINGKMTKFELEKTESLKNKHIISISNSEDKKYTLTIDIIETGEIDETTQNEGTLTLKSKDGKEIIKNIIGECGC